MHVHDVRIFEVWWYWCSFASYACNKRVWYGTLRHPALGSWSASYTTLIRNCHKYGTNWGPLTSSQFLIRCGSEWCKWAIVAQKHETKWFNGLVDFVLHGKVAAILNNWYSNVHIYKHWRCYPYWAKFILPVQTCEKHTACHFKHFSLEHFPLSSSPIRLGRFLLPWSGSRSQEGPIVSICLSVSRRDQGVRHPSGLKKN